MSSDLRFALTLASLLEQGLGERTDPAFEAIAENCWDPNTDAKKRRRLTIHIDVVPDENRRHLAVEMDVITSLARTKKFGIPGYLTRDPVTQRPVIVAFDPHQAEMFKPEQERPVPGVTPFNRAAPAQAGNT
jgi:hypothetical protein